MVCTPDNRPANLLASAVVRQNLTARRFPATNRNQLGRIRRTPNAGSSCRFSAAELLGTRRVPVSGFPRNLIFYKVEDREVFVLGVIHGARDLENLFVG